MPRPKLPVVGSRGYAGLGMGRRYRALGGDPGVFDAGYKKKTSPRRTPMPG